MCVGLLMKGGRVDSVELRYCGDDGVHSSIHVLIRLIYNVYVLVIENIDSLRA